MKRDYIVKLRDSEGRVAVRAVRHKHMDVAAKRAEKLLSTLTGEKWHHAQILTL